MKLPKLERNTCPQQFKLGEPPGADREGRTLGLQSLSKNGCGAAKKRVKKARLAVAPTGDSDSGQPQASRGSQPQNLQKPGKSGAHRKTKERTKHGSSSAGPESSESKGHTKCPGKRQRPSGGTPEGWQANRPKQAGRLSYARAARGGIRMATVSEDYPGIQISRENFVDIQWNIGRLGDEFLKKGSSPGLSIPTGLKGQPLWSAKTNRLETGWLLGYPP